MSRVIATLACLVVGACGGSRSDPSVAASSDARDGVYEFTATVPSYEPGKTIRLQGMLTVLGDSLLIQSPNGCVTAAEYGRVVPKGMPGTTTAKGYYCGGAWLSFAGRDPVKSAMWYASVPVPKQRNACVEYVRRETRQVCVRYRPETYYEYQTRSGGLQLKLIS